MRLDFDDKGSHKFSCMHNSFYEGGGGINALRAAEKADVF